MFTGEFNPICSTRKSSSPDFRTVDCKRCKYCKVRNVLLILSAIIYTFYRHFLSNNNPLIFCASLRDCTPPTNLYSYYSVVQLSSAQNILSTSHKPTFYLPMGWEEVYLTVLLVRNIIISQLFQRVRKSAICTHCTCRHR